MPCPGPPPYRNRNHGPLTDIWASLVLYSVYVQTDVRDTVKFGSRLQCDIPLHLPPGIQHIILFSPLPRALFLNPPPPQSSRLSFLSGCEQKDWPTIPWPSGSEVVMLASISQMETVRSFPGTSGGSMRQPSAEDLDAAQQLISSAQAGREHLARQYGESTPIKGTSSPPPNGPPSASAYSADGRADSQPLAGKTSPKSQKDTSFLGHSCRCVPSSITSSIAQGNCQETDISTAIAEPKTLHFGVDRQQVR